MSKFDKLLNDLKIDETFTKPQKRKLPPNQYNHVKDNIPMISDYNMMADLLFLPSDNGNKYLLVIVDLATNNFDCEPIKNKNASTVLAAMEKCFKRNYIKQPKASIRTDAGKEFKGVFHKWLYDHNILHKVGLPGRHNQMANVENLNKQLGRLLNGFMNAVEVKTGKTSKKWIAALPIIRKQLNDIRELDMPDEPEDVDIIPFDPYVKTKNGKYIMLKPKYKIGQKVFYVSPLPLTALGKKQPTTNFRVGDRQWSADSHKIKEIYSYANPSRYRYGLSEMNNVSFMEHELMLDK
jgi:hypothetical protein